MKVTVIQYFLSLLSITSGKQPLAEYTFRGSSINHCILVKFTALKRNYVFVLFLNNYNTKISENLVYNMARIRTWRKG